MTKELRTFMVGLVVVAAATTATLQFAGGMLNSYDSNVPDSSEWQELEDAADTAGSKSSGILQQQRNATAGIGGAIAENVFIIGPIFQGLRATFSSLTSVPAILSSFITVAQLPAELQAWLYALITILVIFGIYSAYRAYEV